MQMSCWEWSKPSWPCEAWPSDPIFFPDTYNDLVTFPVVVPVSSPFSRRLQYPRSGFGGDHDPWPLTRRYFAVTHVWIPRGDLKLRHSNLHELRIYTWYTATSITSSIFTFLELYQLSGTLGILQNTFKTNMQNTFEFRQIFSTASTRTFRRSIYSYLGNLFVRNFTRISFRNRKLSRLCSIRTIVS